MADIPPMAGKSVLITGGTGGIGKATAIGLAALGARVGITGRDQARAAAAAAGIRAATGSPAVDVFAADMSAQAEVRRLAAQVLGTYPRLDVLVNNVGGFWAHRHVTSDGLEYTFALNYLAPFLLTNLLLDRLTASSPARIVTVSSGAQARGRIDFDDLQGERNYSGQRAYSQSKLANVMFTYELARRLEGTGVTATVLHPGVVHTHFGAEDQAHFGILIRMAGPFMKTPAQGAVTPVYLASSPQVEGVTGVYFANRKPKTSAKTAYDTAAAARLWQASADLADITTTGQHHDANMLDPYQPGFCAPDLSNIGSIMSGRRPSPGAGPCVFRSYVSRTSRTPPGKLRRGKYRMAGSLLGAVQRGKERLPMNGKYVGYVAGHDPLHDFLSKIVRDLMNVRETRPAFRAFRLSGSNVVYAYEEKSSGNKIICKFYGPRFAPDWDKAAWKARQEYEGLETLRRYQLVGSPHHVIRPLGFSRDINGVLAVEYYSGEEFSHAISRATCHRDDAHLLWRLKALAYFLATQHNRTANGTLVDFDADCRYFNTVTGRLRETHRIRHCDLDELSALRDRWRDRPQMWQDQQVWLHGDATPANFLFGDGMDVAAIDLERMKRGDRMFDVGRVAGELQHAFMRDAGDRHRAEPFIGHFLWEYSCHFPDRQRAFESITARLPYYMALNLLRVARNDYIDRDYGGRLVRQAKRLLQAA